MATQAPFLLCLLLICAASAQYSDRVLALLSNLSVEQKVGQMTQLNIDLIYNSLQMRVDRDKVREYARSYGVGSYLNSPTSGFGKPLNASQWLQVITDIQSVYQEEGLPAIIFGVDSVHGANYIDGATIFPQQINAAAAFNPSLTFLMGEITARETRAVGIPWTFSPILDIAVHPAWPRVYETFGEDPIVVATMGAAMIQGYQGNPINLNSDDHVAACFKHFIGYGNPRTGKDRTTSQISDRQLRQYYLPSFQLAIDVGVATGMESYNDVNGEPVVMSSKYLKKILRDEMGFKGMLVTDWAEIIELTRFHNIVPDQKEATRLVMSRTSVDMSMVPSEISFAADLSALVREGVIAESRLDESVLRVLQLKENLGLLDRILPNPDNPGLRQIGSAEHRQVALDIARGSIVLLQNKNNVLPLNVQTLKRIFVVGPSSDSLSYLCGGWTINWQGTKGIDEFFRFGTTIFQGIKAIAAANAGLTVVNQYGFNPEGQYTEDSLNQAIAETNAADVTIVCMSETTYAEAPGDIVDLAYPYGQLNYVRTLINTGKPVIVVLTQGRPRILYDAVDNAAAVLNAMLPGIEGGQAIAEILFGQVNPSGKLPYSYPRNPASVPLQYYHTATSVDDFHWPFGHGLSYSTFRYSSLRLSNTTLRAPLETIEVSVDITNDGPYAGQETVLVYLKDLYREVVPESKLLFTFIKLSLNVGQTATYSTVISASDLAFYGIDETVKIVESGEHLVMVAGLTSSFNVIASPFLST